MTDITLTLDVLCSKCRNELKMQTNTDYYGKTTEITIEPCQTCLEKANAEGDNEGYTRGYDEGLDEGASEA